MDQPGFLLGLGLGAPQALGQRRVRMRAFIGGGRTVVVAAVAARQRFADRVLQVRIALEAQLLAELDHARLADAQRAGQLLRGVVAQQVRVVEQEVGDAALDRRHVVALGADFEQRRHLSRSYRSEEHTSELQSLMRISYAVFFLKKTNKQNDI